MVRYCAAIIVCTTRLKWSILIVRIRRYDISTYLMCMQCYRSYTAFEVDSTEYALYTRNVYRAEFEIFISQSYEIQNNLIGFLFNF